MRELLVQNSSSVTVYIDVLLLALWAFASLSVENGFHYLADCCDFGE